MDELSDWIARAINLGEPLHMEFQAGGKTWILSMRPLDG